MAPSGDRTPLLSSFPDHSLLATPLLATPPLIAIALLAALALPPGSSEAGAAGAAGVADPPPLALVVRSADRPAVDLDGQTLAGDVYISAVPPERIREAVFFLDDPAKTKPFQSEKRPPFDLRGGDPGHPTPWDTRTVPDGPHRLVAVITAVGGGSHELAANFTVANAPSPFRFDREGLRSAFSAGDTAPRTREVLLHGEAGESYRIDEGLPTWLVATPLSGTTPATITLRIDPSALALGAHAATVTARSGEREPVTLAVEASVHDPAQPLARSVERHGFVWELEDFHPVGTFAGGDPWVVGPVRIESVSPGWNGAHGGSMANPRYGGRQGYDSRFSFEPSLRLEFPRVVRGGESIVSTSSWRGDEPGSPSIENTLNLPRPALRAAAVLTVVAAPPPPGSFRPPYTGGEAPRFTIGQLHPERLPMLPRVDGTPSLADQERRFERLWLDHVPQWKNRYVHPSENMRDYCRDIARTFNDGSLLLCLDFSAEEKQTLMVRLVQIGIDMHGVLRSGATWGDGGGGLGSGRKWPILLAGILLDDAAMMGIGRDYGPEIALEDCQTFTLTEAERAHYPDSAVGDPVWGERHCFSPGNYVDPGNISYRTCCTANAWVGAVLSAHILGARELWDHPPLFDYQDRYMAEQPLGEWQRSLSDFAEAMWDTYRGRYGPIWPHD